MGYMSMVEFIEDVQESREQSLLRHNQHLVERRQRLIEDWSQVAGGAAGIAIFIVFMRLLKAITGL
jgi:hypothetical protein